MNAPSPDTDEPPKETPVDMRAALIAELGLTDLAVEKIGEVMQSMNITFADAATRLGLLEPDAGENAPPARVVGGLGRVALFVRADHRAHALTPSQFLHSATASTALIPNASAPV